MTTSHGVAAAALLLLGSLGLPQAQAAQTPTKVLPIEEINSSPSRWWGKQVTVKGEIEKLYAKGSFVLEGDNGPHDEILVIPAQTHLSEKQSAGVRAGLNEDEDIRVTGTVKQLTQENITKLYGREIDPEHDVTFHGSMPVIVAQEIEPAEDRR